jgi:serine protease SohB
MLSTVAQVVGCIMLIIVLLYFLAGASALAMFISKIQLRMRTRRLRQHAAKRLGLFRLHRDIVYLVKEAYGPKWKEESEAFDAQESEEDKEKRNPLYPDSSDKKPVAVIQYRGDIQATNHNQFARYVDEVIVNADRFSEVRVVLESPGGMMNTYGHINSQMERLRESGLHVTAHTNEVAASGGYLSIAPAHRIVAAPFAYVGSIGVITSIPNVRPLLESWGIIPRTFTAGKHKRTVTMTNKLDEEDERAAALEKQLAAHHRQFLDCVRKYRTNAKMDVIESGSHWTAQESMDLDLGLIDEIGTWADHALQLNWDRDLVFITPRVSPSERGVTVMQEAAQSVLRTTVSTLTDSSPMV